MTWYSKYLYRSHRSEYTIEIASGALEFKLPLGLLTTVSSVDQEYENTDPEVLKKCSNNQLYFLLPLPILISSWNDLYRYLGFSSSFFS